MYKYTKFIYLISFHFTVKIIKDILQEENTKTENSLEKSDITVSQKTALYIMM